MRSAHTNDTCSISWRATLLTHHLKSDLFGAGDGDSIIRLTAHLSKGERHWDIPGPIIKHHYLDDWLNQSPNTIQDVLQWVSSLWRLILVIFSVFLFQRDELEHQITASIPCHLGTDADLGGISQEDPGATTNGISIKNKMINHNTSRVCRRSRHVRAQTYTDVHVYASPLAVFQCSQNHSTGCIM